MVATECGGPLCSMTISFMWWRRHTNQAIVVRPKVRAEQCAPCQGLCVMGVVLACATMPSDNCVKCFIFSVSFWPEIGAKCQLLVVPFLPYWKGYSLRKEASV